MITFSLTLMAPVLTVATNSLLEYLMTREAQAFINMSQFIIKAFTTPCVTEEEMKEYEKATGKKYPGDPGVWSLVMSNFQKYPLGQNNKNRCFQQDEH